MAVPFDPVSYVLARRAVRNVAQRLEEHRSKVPIDHPDASVTSAKIASGAVTSSHIADGAVTATKIADGAVTAAKIAPSAVDYSKIADIETAVFVKLVKLDADKNPDARFDVFRGHKDVVVSLWYYWDSKGSYGPRLGVRVRIDQSGNLYDFKHESGLGSGPHRIMKYYNGSWYDLATGLGSREDVGVWYFNDACQIIGSTLTFVDRGEVIGSVDDTDIPQGDGIMVSTWDSGNVVRVRDLVVKRAASYVAPPARHVYLRVPKVVVEEGGEKTVTNPVTVLSNVLLGRPVPAVVVLDLGREMVVAVHEGIAGDLASVFPRVGEDEVMRMLRERGRKIVDVDDLRRRFYGWNEHVDRKPLERDEARMLMSELLELIRTGSKSYGRVRVEAVRQWVGSGRSIALG